MKLNISFNRYIVLILFSIFTINSIAQVAASNRISERDFELNNSDSTILLNKSNDLNSSDTVSLPFIKSDFIVNSFDGEYGANQSNVIAAIDGNGNYAFTWLDYRNGVPDIYLQFFDNSDNRVGSIIKVNEDPLIISNYPFIDANASGDFVVVWIRDRGEIMGQKFTKDGQKVGTNILLSNILGWNTRNLSVAVNIDGSFMCTWSAEPGNFQVYASLFDSDGYPIAQNIIVSEPSYNSTFLSKSKTIAVDETGNYCLTWSSNSGSSSTKIFLQLINSSGQKLGNNVLVSHPNDSLRNYQPTISSTNDGYFFILWEKELPAFTGTRVGGRIYHSDGYFVTADVLLYTEQESSWHSVEVSSDRDSTFLILAHRNGTHYFQKIDKFGGLVGDTIRVKYNSSISGYHYANTLSDIVNDKCYVALSLYDRIDYDIYLQKFNGQLEPSGSFEEIYDDKGSADQRRSIVKFNNRGEVIVLWADQRNGRSDLYAQVYDEEFNPIGDNIQVNDTDGEYWSVINKKVQSFSDGSFVIAFGGYETYSSSKLHLQIVSNSGEKVGQNKLVKENYSYEYGIELNVNSNDEILLSWFNRYDVNIRLFDKMLNPISSEKKLLESSDIIGFQPVTVSVDSLFNIIVIWNNYYFESHNYDNRIRGKFFEQDGNADSSSFVIDTVESYVKEYFCKNEGHNYALLYKDGSRIYLKRNYDLDKSYSFKSSFYSYGYEPDQMNIVEFRNQKIYVTYNSSLNVIGYFANDNKNSSETYLLHKYDYINTGSNSFNGRNGVDIFGDKIIFTYESIDNGGTGYDIWANVRKLDNVDFYSELFYPPVDYDILYNNFPNPFNLVTRIAYQILAYHKVKLTIYDILGREVKVLVDENQEKGIYEVDFNASGLASGIYFYRLDAFNTTVKKMLLLK